jgi:acetoin utilization protein AcuB
MPSRPREEREPTMRDVMSPSAATVGPSTLVGDAHRLLREHKISHLPVLDGDLLVGIVSQRDLLRADSDALPVSHVMATMVYVLSPDTPMSRAARIFRERRVPVLPVLDGRTLAGFVRAVDVLETAWDRAKS